jgi:hypothetical protein
MAAEQKIAGSTTFFDGYNKLWILEIAAWACKNQESQLLLEAKICCQLV